ncbi:MAG: tyrosine-type recombinase/integrase, partial [Colwellia sp.]
SKYGRSVRTTNSILVIGRRTIDFLSFIQDYHFIDNFIGSQGCSITVEGKFFHFHSKSGENKKLYWHHSSFPLASPIKSKSPISTDVVKKLKLGALKTSDKHIRLRRRIMLYAYEVTGGRRVEIVNIKVDSILESLESSDSSPLLSMFTAKRGKVRKVPVPRGFLQDCMFYVEMSRRRIIRNTIGIKNDHGYLFINHRTGNPLTAETLTGEMNRLCQVANVDSSIGHGHLFRHGFITRIMVDLISRHNINNKDEFRRALINTEALKLELQQYTGHSNSSSLDTYIDLAFNEITNYKETMSTVMTIRSTELMLEQLTMVTNEATFHDTITSDVIKRMQTIIHQFRESILMNNNES